MQMQNAHADLLRQVLALPAASFREAHVERFITQFAAERDLPCETDRFGNLYITYKRGRGKRQPVVLEAHLDHPGFSVKNVKGNKAELEFLGKIPEATVEGEKVLIYNEDSLTPKARATIISSKRQDHFYRPLTLTAELDGDAAPGDFGVWDLTTWTLRGTRLASRAHDDLAEVAAVLVTLDELARTKPDAHLIGLFTRAEEVGFVGAYGATTENLLPKDAVVIALECSGLPRSTGVVVRCGDFTSIFDGWASTRLLQLADAEAAKHKDFIFQTPIPRRGTCNASLYHARGWCATGITIPLENYHNGGDGKIKPEIIGTDDWARLVHFLPVVATQFGDCASVRDKINTRLDGIWKEEKKNLTRKK